MRLTGKKLGKILCDYCGQPMTAGQQAASGIITCQVCGAVYEGAFFNVAERFRPQVAGVVTAQQAQDAQCFFHPGKGAHAVCFSCGRMLCALCDIELNAGHICPSCMNEQQGSGADSEPRSSWSYAQLAWGLILFSFVIPVLPAAVGIGFAVAGLRNSDYCVSTGRKLNLVLAIALAIVQLGVILVLLLG